MRRAVWLALLLVASAIVLAGCSATAGTAAGRHIELEGQPNFRDVGGYATTDGRTVRRGEVYRSGALSDLSDADVQRLAALGLRTDVNFLTDAEVESRGDDRLPEGTVEVRLAIESDDLDELAAGAGRALGSGAYEDLPLDLNAEIHRVLVEDGRTYYATMLRKVADPANRPLVFHCSAGVHRAGTAAAILLWSLDVPWETVREDYLLSNVYRADTVDRSIERWRGRAAQAQGTEPVDVDMTNVEALYVLEGWYIDAVRDRIIADYGSVDGYLIEGLGLTPAEIDRLRSSLIE